MVSPIYLIAVALLVAFVLGLADRVSRGLSISLTLGALAWMVGLSIAWLVALFSGAAVTEVLTAGFSPPFAINLRMGLLEAGLLTAVNLAFLGTAVMLVKRLRSEHLGAQILLLMMAMGSNGLVLTRDLFNVFVFLEITAIATYGMIALSDDEHGLAAGFKYVIAGGLSSAFFLVGTIYLYRLTGTLNIDGMIEATSSGALLAGGAGFAALFLVVGALLVELKPFPANGWALDVYQSAHPAVAAVISVGTSGGILAAVYKMIPMMSPSLLTVLAAVGALTFALSNLVGLRQGNTRRMLGYSSVAQMGLVVSALSFAALQGWGGATTLLVAGGILINHLLAKAGLFWMAGHRGAPTLQGLAGRFSGRRPALALIGIFVVALAGLPPFPTFWAKWALVGELVTAGGFVWIAVILAGSLFEAVYLFRFLGAAITLDVLSARPQAPTPASTESETLPAGGTTAISPVLFAVLLPVSGLVTAWVFGFREVLLYVPILAALGMWLLDWLPAKVKTAIAVALVLGYGAFTFPLLEGVGRAFLGLFAGGAAVAMLALLNRRRREPGLVPAVTLLVLAMAAIPAAESSLAFFLAFELATVSSYLLLLRRRRAARAALRYLAFALGGAFSLMVGLILLSSAGVTFALPHVSAAPTVAIGFEAGGAASAGLQGAGAVLGGAASETAVAGGAAGGGAGTLLAGLILVALGFLVKAGAAGAHIWLPGAYAEAEDDVSPLFSGILSKVPVAGLVLVIGLVLAGTGMSGAAGMLDGSGAADVFLAFLGWIGALTALFGALLAVYQQDVKYLLAYSSMSQLGYIVMAFVMGTQLGWTTGLYLSMLHLTFKVMLFLSIAGVVMRTGTRVMHDLGGLIKRMPLTFISALMAIIATSGVPPLAGFGGKWMLYTALLERGWYFQAAVAFFASTVAFLYLFKFIYTVFLGQMKDDFRQVREAPAWLLVPQLVLAAGLMLVSMYPNVMLEPLLAAAGAYLGTQTVLEGYSVISTLGYWNGNMVMYVTMVVFIVPLVWLLVVMRRPQRVEQFNIVYAAERPERPETTHVAYNFFSHYNRALGFLSAPGVISFWGGVREGTASVASAIRRIYSGNGQTYAIHIVLFVFVLFLIAGGLS